MGQYTTGTEITKLAGILDKKNKYKNKNQSFNESEADFNNKDCFASPFP